MKAANTHRAAFDAAEPGLLEKSEDLARIDMTMAMKVREKTRVPLRMPEINDKQAALGLEHAAHFPSTLLAHLARQVVEHECTQHHVEMNVREWQRLGNGVL